jgi:hypothetical protein
LTGLGIHHDTDVVTEHADVDDGILRERIRALHSREDASVP